MIDIEEYKKALGDVTDKLSEVEILKVRQIQDELAEILYVLWREKLQDNIQKECQKIMKEETALSIAE